MPANGSTANPDKALDSGFENEDSDTNLCLGYIAFLIVPLSS